MLLGRPWLHENGVVPSTWHQCLKYCQGGEVKKVIGDSNPFMESESHFADAKYYLKSKKVIKINESAEDSKGKAPLEKEESLKDLILPLTDLNISKPIPPPLAGFVRPTQGGTFEHGELSEQAVAKNYGPKAFSLLVKAGYGSKPRNGHPGNAKWQVKKPEPVYNNPKSNTGLGFPSKTPIRIAIRRANTSYISEGEESTTEVGFKRQDKRVSVFERLGPLGKDNEVDLRSSYVKPRMDDYPKLRSSIPTRMKRKTIVTVTCGRELKAKKQTIIFTRTKREGSKEESVASSNTWDYGEEASSYHITSNEGEISEEEEKEEKEEEQVLSSLDEVKKFSQSIQVIFNHLQAHSRDPQEHSSTLK